MKQPSKYRYLLLEQSYLLRKSLILMLSELRPTWDTLGYCEHSGQLQQRMKLKPDFILAGSHLSDGECINTLQQQASHTPTILYTHILDESKVRNSLPNLSKFIYEPVSREEMTEAVSLIEEYMEVKQQII